MDISAVLLSIVVMLAATALCVILFQPLGFGAILGFIVAGVLVGPHTPGPVPVGKTGVAVGTAVKQGQTLRYPHKSAPGTHSASSASWSLATHWSSGPMVSNSSAMVVRQSSKVSSSRARNNRE